MQIEWSGQGVNEAGVDANTGNTVVRVDPRYFRPTEVDTLLGDPTKANTLLNWQPEISFEDLVTEMVDADLNIAERDALVAREGFPVYNHHE